MNNGAAGLRLRGRPLWVKVALGVLLLAAALVLLAVFFPWDTLRGPVNRYVSERTGRHFEITRQLDVKLGRTTRILAEGIEFANPAWAKDPYLVKAEGGEIQIRLLPLLLHRRIELSLLELRKPQLGLQVEPDGRRSWALGRDTGDPANVPDIGALVVDQGSLHYIASKHGADIHTDFAIEGPLAMPNKEGAASSGNTAGGEQVRPSLPLMFNARGTWQKEAFTARGRTGNVLYLSAPLQRPFPIEIDAVAGETRFIARGGIASLATLDGADAVVDLQGKSLAHLYKFFGVVLPETPRYAVRGHVFKKGEVWSVKDLNGKLGNTDMRGDLSFDRSQKVPQLAGTLQSKWLDFNDLAPLVGLGDKPRGPRAEAAQVARAQPTAQRRDSKKTKAPRDPNRKVLPQTPMDLARLKAMNSEVSYKATRVTNVRRLPLDRLAVQVRLRDGVLSLDSMNLGVADGTVTGKMRIDSHANPAAVELHLDARSLELRELLRSEELAKSSFGRLHGDFDLNGRGNSVAQMLASASGDVSLLMGPGQISNLLMEIAGLDGAEIIKFLVGGDQNVRVRCAATAFEVNKGLMTSRVLLFDTNDTVVYGKGNVNLASEQMDFYFRPYPKDASILSLRSPLRLTGTLGAPDTGPDKTALAQRAGFALALGVVNPLLALAATIETGPGKDANCGAILREAATPGAGREMQLEAREQEKAAQRMGGPGERIQSVLSPKDSKGEEKNAAGTPKDSAASPEADPQAPAGTSTKPHAPGVPDKPYGQ